MTTTDTATLYGAPGSGSACIEAALGIAGVAHRRIDAAPWAEPSPEPSPERDAGLAALRRANPLAQLPTLQLADGTVLTESAAILIHLGLAHPASGLLPADASARARAIRGLVYVGANCYAAIGVIDYPERWCADADEPMRQAVVAGTRARLHGLWDVFADTFAPGIDGTDHDRWLGGERLGALDLLVANVSKWSGARAHLRASRPAFFGLLERIEAHPAVAPVWARHWPPAA